MSIKYQDVRGNVKRKKKGVKRYGYVKTTSGFVETTTPRQVAGTKKAGDGKPENRGMERRETACPPLAW